MVESYPEGVVRLHNFFEQLLHEDASYYVITDEEDYIFLADSQQHDDDEGDALAVMLLWSKDYLDDAKLFAEDKTLKPISIDHFLEDMLPELLKNQTLLGLNWSEEGECVELFPEEFLDILDEASEEVNDNDN